MVKELDKLNQNLSYILKSLTKETIQKAVKELANAFAICKETAEPEIVDPR